MGEHYDLILYGGQSDAGSFNDIWFFSTSKKIWYKGIAIGTVPKLKDHSAVVFYEEFTILDGKIVVFGGINEGKVTNEVYLMEVTFINEVYYVEIIKAEVDGDVPSPRSGHKAFLRGNKMILIGGCNHQKGECYNDIYSLDLLKLPMKWVTLERQNAKISLPSAREGFALASTKENILIIGGCNEKKDCFKESYELQMKDDCIVKCPNENMVYDGILEECVCKEGFSGDKCQVSEKVRCPGRCSYHGRCTEDAECLCEDNYYGNNCQYEFCKDDCSGNGACNKTDLSCKCDHGYFSVNCEAICPRNCTSHGICRSNKCDCLEGYSGNKCNVPEGIQGCWRYSDGDSVCFTRNVDGIYGVLQEKNESFIFQETHKEANITQFRFKEESVKEYSGELFTRNNETGKLIPTNVSIKIKQNLDVLEFIKIILELEDKPKMAVRVSSCNEAKECSGHGICRKENNCTCYEGFKGLYCQRDLHYEKEAKRIKETEKKRLEDKNPDFVNVEEHREIELKAPIDSLLAMNTSYLGYVLGVELDDIHQEIDIHNITNTLTSVVEKISKLEEENQGMDDINDEVNKKETVEKYRKEIGNLTLPEGIELEFDEGGSPVLSVKRKVFRLRKMKRKEVRNKTAIREIDPQEEAKEDAIRKEMEKKREKEAIKAKKRQEKAKKMLEKRNKKRSKRKSSSEKLKELREAQAKERKRNTCPNNCLGNGVCLRGEVVGRCKCFLGWNGHSCQHEYCPNNCTTVVNGKNQSTGMCNKHKEACTCFVGFTGDGCMEVIPCPSNCTDIHHGLCLDDATCKCNEEYWLDDCSWLKCPNNCNGNGICVNGTCHCYQGYFEDDCSSSCLRNCSSHGVCNHGDCICQRGFGGDDCGYLLECEGNCSFNGKCVFGECYCNIGWEGISCSEVTTCPDHCSDRGNCMHGKCKCHPGYEGTRCEFIVQCPNKCSLNGKCLWGKCFCNPGYEGLDCSLFIPCPRNCSGHGSCFDGECFCAPEFYGKDCSNQYDERTDRCQDNCHGLGECRQAKCNCYQGFSGDTCEIEDKDYFQDCKKDLKSPICSGNGMCINKKCKCYPGYYGTLCQDKYHHCMNNCTSPLKGLCYDDHCACKPGWEGEDCGGRSVCPENCNKRGVCMKGKCLCDQGFVGDLCEKTAESEQEEIMYKFKLAKLFDEDEGCKDNCNGQGICDSGECKCNSEYEGKYCETYNPKKCLDDCNKRGICKQGRCFCFFGFTGELCEHILVCPDECSKKGVCRHGICHCLNGHAGAACELEVKIHHVPLVNTGDYSLDAVRCPNDCNKRGLCIEGVCYCEEGYYGFHCGYSESSRDLKCRDDCSGYGECISGKCYCYPGYFGDNCASKTNFMCPENGLCSLHGNCVNGKCECDPYFSGPTCSEFKCTILPFMDECSSHGICRNGNCYCDPGYSGLDCSMKFNSTGCPGDCSQKGLCVDSSCVCIEGYSGIDCTIASFRFKEKTSSNEDMNELNNILSMPNTNKCKNGCGGKGKCIKGKCHCNEGYIGEYCEIHSFYIINSTIFPISILPDCSFNSDCNSGNCLDGTCECTFPHYGSHCQNKYSSDFAYPTPIIFLMGIVVLVLSYTCVYLFIKSIRKFVWKSFLI